MAKPSIEIFSNNPSPIFFERKFQFFHSEKPSKIVEKLDFEDEENEEIIEPPTEFSEPIKDDEAMPTLQRSSSLVDLEHPDKLVTLCKSTSMIDLSQLGMFNFDSFLNSFVH